MRTLAEEQVPRFARMTKALATSIGYPDYAWLFPLPLKGFVLRSGGHR